MSSHRSRTCSLALAAIGLLFLIAPPALAQRGEPVQANVELQHAFDAAQTSARASDSLDPAYELLGIAGTAQARDIKPLAPNAAAAFVDLVQRATAAAQRKRGSAARDTLDQLVDLRFLAKSEEIQPAMKALDAAMRVLFPEVSEALQKSIDTAKDWDERLSLLNELASLQGSAVQVMMNDVAATIGAAFDARVATLDKIASQDADDAERARKLGGLAEAKRTRTEQTADAAANNVDAVAAHLKSGGKERGRSMDAGVSSCVETGYRSKQLAQKNQADHDRACVDSGRVPSAGARCPVANVSLACYGRVADGESITYVYSNTPEEAATQKSCAAADQLPANRIPASGAAFRSKDVSLAFVCAPSTEAAAD